VCIPASSCLASVLKAERRADQQAQVQAFLKKYPQYANWIEAKNLSSDMMQKFVDYLVENHKGKVLRRIINVLSA
jgi:hypothetical protein